MGLYPRPAPRQPPAVCWAPVHRPSRPARAAALCAALALGCSAAPAPLPWEEAAGGPDLSALGCVAVQVPGDAAVRARLTADLRDLGVARVRWELTWYGTEREKGRFDWALADAGVAAIAAAGAEPLLAVVGGNPLYPSAAAGDEWAPPDDPADFARFAGAAAARFGAPGRVFEVWNEENAGYRFWRPRADAAAYARLFNAARAAIRAACPGCLVIAGAPVTEEYPTVPAGPRFLADALAAGLTGADGQGVHPYPLYPPCSPPEGGENRCALWKSRSETPLVRQLAEVAGAAGGLPAWITEFGWPTALPPTGTGEVTEALQAQWLARAFLLAAAQGARSACWWTWSDDERSGQFPPEGDFGLVRKGGARKASFAALADLLHSLRPLRFVRDRGTELDLRAGEHALLFQLAPEGGRDRLATFLWREEEAAARTLTLRTHGPSELRRVGEGAPVQVPGAAAVVEPSPSPFALVTLRP